MIIKIETGCYNTRRYSRPYIALLNPNDLTVIKWGNWLGTHGYDGELSIETAEDTCIIMYGRKDYRGNTPPNYRVYSGDNKIIAETNSRYEAVKVYHSQFPDKSMDAHLDAHL